MILRGTLFSKVLDMDTGITLLTPNGAGAEEPYRVLYLLHGVCGSSSNFLDYTMLAAHAAPYRCVIVMPDAQRSFYADMAYGQKFFTYIAEELPEICKNTFRISARPEDTFIMGASMGGYGAFKCALTHPGRYGACCAFSPGSLYLKDFLAEMWAHDESGAPLSHWGSYLIGDFRAAFGETFAWSSEIELLELAKRVDSAAAPRLYAACGTKDDLLPSNRDFAADMRALGLAYTYEEWEGGHDWYFFDEALKRALAFALA